MLSAQCSVVSVLNRPHKPWNFGLWGFCFASISFFPDFGVSVCFAGSLCLGPVASHARFAWVRFVLICFELKLQKPFYPGPKGRRFLEFQRIECFNPFLPCPHCWWLLVDGQFALHVRFAWVRFNGVIGSLGYCNYRVRLLLFFEVAVVFPIFFPF